MVADGKFREDLYFRLNVIAVHVPPLRERRDEIPFMAAFFLDRERQRHGRGVLSFSKEALDTLVHHDWPGNVRELQHAIERAAAVSTGSVIESSALGLSAGAVRDRWSDLIATLGEATMACDPSALRLIEDIEPVVYQYVYDRCRQMHRQVDLMVGWEHDAQIARRYRWKNRFVKLVLSGERKLDEVPHFLRQAVQKSVKATEGK